MAKNEKETEGKVVDVTEQSVAKTPSREIPKKEIKQVKEYDIISFKSPEKLKVAVNNALNAGWELVGGLCVNVIVTPNGAETLFSQAVAKV